MLLFGGLLTMLKKPQNCPISDFFDLTPKYFLVFLHYTDLVPPSTDPVPPSTNQYCPKPTQYHQVPLNCASYCPSFTNTKQYCPIQTHYHQIPTNTDLKSPVAAITYQNPMCVINKSRFYRASNETALTNQKL